MFPTRNRKEWRFLEALFVAMRGHAPASEKGDIRGDYALYNEGQRTKKERKHNLFISTRQMRRRATRPGADIKTAEQERGA